MRLVLFDIDGTLLDSGGIGLSALWAGLVTAFDLDLRVVEAPLLDLAGATDHGVAGELFAQYGIADTPENRERFFAAYLPHLEAMLGTAEGFRVLPGVEALLPRLGTEFPCHLGLLTGNLREGAFCKLRRAGLESYFGFGAFGTDRPRRDELGPVALQRARDYTKRDWTGAEVVVIGDTPRDVGCARAIGAACMAVATGSFGRAELETAGAEVVLDDLSDGDAFLAAIERVAPGKRGGVSGPA